MSLMWDIIESNKRKSLIIFFLMGIFFLVLGYFAGAALVKGGGIYGIFAASFIWLILSLISYFQGDSLILAVSKAKLVTHDLHPQLFNVVEEMKIAANLPAMPKVYIIPEHAPNAFAVGRSPDKSAVVVTAGLLERLNRDELQGVIAHEMSHILNRDVLLLTFAGILMGSIVILSEVFLRGMFFSRGSSRRYRSGSGGGQAQIIIMVIALVLAILAPIIARLFYFAISRKREYLADASGARLTRYPEGLASALEKISSGREELPEANKVTAPMYIINPLKAKKASFSSLSSTHPPTHERIRILRSMAGGVNYQNYNQAFLKVKGSSVGVLPKSVADDEEAILARPASKESRPSKGKKAGARDLGDLIRVLNGYVFITCACGLKIKVPKDYKNLSIKCPRCGRQNTVPLEGLIAASAMLSQVAGAGSKGGETSQKEQPVSDTPQVYIKKGSGWESFNCRCGRLINLSPSFQGNHVTCSKCGKVISIARNR